MDNVLEYLPKQVNTGSFLTAYTLDKLKPLIATRRVVLPICSLGESASRLASLGPLVLPPLYHEALDDELKAQLLSRIKDCFPYYQGTQARESYQGSFEVIELPKIDYPAPPSPRVLAFSVDTAVEEHGPHLPLATDTIQSYGVLRRLAKTFDGLLLGPPVEYGHLTWGLPFGLSIDLTPPLLTRYVTGFVNAIIAWMAPQSLYVVDVHGSIVHRTAIIDGLQQSGAKSWSFRWLHEPLIEFAGDRGDQHAGGVETALVELIDPALVDQQKWQPDNIDSLIAGQMSLIRASELSANLSDFIEYVETHPCNGVVGDLNNYQQLNAELLMQRMLDVAEADLRELVEK